MKPIFFIALAAALGASAHETDSLHRHFTYWGATAVNVSSGDYAPYFIGALNGGRVTRATSGLADIGFCTDIDKSKRLSWGAGVEIVGGYSSDIKYDRYDAASATWYKTSNAPAPVWIQQLYVEGKYRQVFARIGQKDHKSHLLDETVSSGDLTRSANARGVPGVAAGFIDFVDIPFTNGWAQIAGEIEYGRFTDDGFTHDQFNEYNYVRTSDVNYTYKYCYFRTRPAERFSVTLGMQTAGQFGGSSETYAKGEITHRMSRGFKIGDAIKMFFPTQGNSNDDYYEGNSLGSWDFKARYRLPGSGSEISFAFQWPWEDGSGIGKLNGFDGLWGIYYNAVSGYPLIASAAVEYLDFTNQSGAIHWTQHDRPGTTVAYEASGADDYYNNEVYGSYSNYGLSIGTPFLVAPVYNLNGFAGFAHNRARGLHGGLRGYLTDRWEYSVKYSWQQAWGRGKNPSAHSFTDNSAMIAVAWDARNMMPGLKFAAKAAIDHGDLRGNNFGILIGATYTGSLTFRKK